MTVINSTTPVSRLLTEYDDLASLGFTCVKDLGVIFQAIDLIPEGDPLAQKLARIGKMLSDDWTNLIDCCREGIDDNARVVLDHGNSNSQ